MIHAMKQRYSVAVATLFVALVFGMGTAHAVSISIDPTTQTVNPGDTVTLEINMDFTDDPTLGGAFDVFFAGSALTFVSWVAEPLGDPDFTPVFTTAPGEVGNIGFGDFAGLSGPALVGTLTFTADSLGSTTFTLADTTGSAGPFFSAATFNQQIVNYGMASVQAVPLPAAGWFIVSGLLPLFVAGRRRKTAAA